MHRLCRVSVRSTSFLFLIAFALASKACSMGSDKQIPTLTNSLTMLPKATTTITHTDRVTSPSILPATSLSPTNLPSTTPSPISLDRPTTTPSLTQPVLEIQIIQAVHYDILNSNALKYIETAFWSEDEEKIYYAFSLEPTDINDIRTLHWRAYDIQSGVSITLTEAPKINRTVVEPVLFASYPDIQRLISPRGRYRLEEVAKEAEEKTEIWLHDIQEQKWIKLLDTCLVCYIYRAEWFRDESKVIFDIAYHTGGEYYLTDIRTGNTELLCQPEDIQCWIQEERITLSPDDEMLAGLAEVDGQYQIRIDRLADRDSVFINEVASQPTWSNDGKQLYYWLGFYDQRNSELRAYDITKGVSSTVFDKSIFEDYEICFNEFGFDYCNFDVSPSGDQFIFWIEGPIDGYIWIVTLP